MRRTVIGLVASIALAVGAVGGITAGAHHDPHAVVAADHAASATPPAADITAVTWRPPQQGAGAGHHGVQT